MTGRVGRAIASGLILAITVPRLHAADSPWLYGIHWYGNPSSNAVEVMTGNKGIWCLETVNVYDGVWNASAQLSKFQTAVSRGHTVVVRIQPRWGLAIAANADMSQYLQDVIATAQQLASITHIWQIGNEINLPWEYDLGGLTPANYISRFKQIRNAIKSVSSPLGQQIVLLAPVAPVDNAWLGGMIDNVTASDFDGFALHSYGQGDAASARANFQVQYATQLNYIDSRGHANKPVYLLEWNRPVSPINATNEAASAQFLSGALQDLNTWNQTAGKHPLVCACWFIYPDDPYWSTYSILGLRDDHPGGPSNDLYDAFQYACTLNLPAGGGAAPGNGPFISRNPALLVANALQGTNAMSQTFTIANGGTGTLNYTIADDANWLSVNPPSGASMGEQDTITVSFTTASLAAGQYSAAITITDPAATNNPQVVSVSLTIQSTLTPPTITNPDFQANGGGWTGAGTGWTTFGGNKWEGVFDGQRSWVQGVAELPASGTCGVYQTISTLAGATYRVSVYAMSQATSLTAEIGVNPSGTSSSGAGYGAGSTGASWTQVTYDFTATTTSATIFLRGRNTIGGFVSGKWCLFDGVSISVLNGPPQVPAIDRSPATLTPNTTAGQSPGSQTFTITNSGSGTLNYQIIDDANWLAVTPSSGNCTGETDTITVNYSTAGLTTGTYNATISISDASAGNSPQTLAVTLTVGSGGGTSGPNLITNPGFEGSFTGGLATGWQSWQSIGSGYWRQSTRLGRIGSGMYSGTAGFNQTVALNPKTVLLSDLALGHSQGLRTALPDAIIVGRLFIDSQFSTYISNPEFYGAQHADNCYNTSLQKPGITCWQGFNEPNLNTSESQARLVGRFEKAFADRCHQLGLKACVMNIAVGNPGDMNRMLLPEIVNALAAGDYVGYHAYGGEHDQLMVGPEDPWYALRWRFYIDMYQQAGYRMPPVLYTECTTFYAWHGVFTAAQIRDDLISFEGLTKQADPWSAGMCIFLIGSSSSQWDGWEVASQPTVYQDCGNYNLNHPADAWNGLYSQQFGSNSGAFTGGLRQVVSVTPGSQCTLTHRMKYETYGVNGKPGYFVGYDLTGQTSDASAATIVWTSNLVSAQSRETDWWYSHSLGFTATGSQVSIWFKGALASGSPWRIMIDDVSLTGTGQPPPVIPGDFDHDTDVDLTDFAHLQACLSGEGIIQSSPACQDARLDSDGDIDQTDYAIFEGCMSGPDIPGNPNCAI